MIDVKKLLKTKGLKFHASVEEYTDHFMTVYEKHEEEHGPAKAEIYTRVAINRLDHQQINKDYFKLFYKNKLLMASSIMTVLTFIFLINTSSPVEDPPSIHPIDISSYDVSSNFGMKKHPVKKKKVMHKGIDLKAEIGEKVRSTAAGIVIKAEYDEKRGYYVEVKHDDHYSTRYFHLSELLVKENEQVKLGQFIGAVGTSGLATGPHLHYEVIVDGKNVDPRKFLKT